MRSVSAGLCSKCGSPFRERVGKTTTIRSNDNQWEPNSLQGTVP